MIDDGASRADKLVLFICALAIAAVIALVGSAQIAFADEGSVDDPTNESLDYESDFDDESDNGASNFDDDESDWDDDEDWDWDDDSDWDDEDSDWDWDDDSDWDDEDSDWDDDESDMDDDEDWDWDDEDSDWDWDDDSDWDDEDSDWDDDESDMDDDEDWDWDNDESDMDDEDWDWDDDSDWDDEDSDWDWDDEDWDWEDDEDFCWDDEDWNWEDGCSWGYGELLDEALGLPCDVASACMAMTAKGGGFGTASHLCMPKTSSYQAHRDERSSVVAPLYVCGFQVSDETSSTIDGQYASSGWAIPLRFGQFLSGIHIPYVQDAMQVGIERDVVQGVGHSFRFAFARITALGDVLTFVFERIAGSLSVQ